MLRNLVWLALLMTGAGALLGAQQNAGDAGLASMGQQATRVIFHHYVFNPAMVGGAGKSLPGNGRWTVGKTAPSACPHTTESCVEVMYQGAAGETPCSWAVLLQGDGSDGSVLEQNEAVAHYFSLQISPYEAKDRILSFQRPAYPPAALAKHLGGSVTVSLFVSATGKVEQAVALGGPEMLRQASVDALQQASFKPYTLGSKAVPFQVTLSLSYESGTKRSPATVSGP
jgi:TonB family protein